MRKQNSKNNLDEMQEQTLLKIESRGMWIAFYGLVLSLLVHVLIGGEQVGRSILGESILLLILSLYIAISCLRHGIWDRKLRPTPKTNLILSVAAGVAVGIAVSVRSYLNYHAAIGSAAVFLFCGGMTFVLCFIAMTACAKLYEKKKSKLEAEEEDPTE